MAVYVVTGGAGFIGSHITTGLVERGDRVRVLDNLVTGDRQNLAHLNPGALGSGSAVEFLQGDLRDETALKEIFKGADGAFHEAAQVSVPLSVEDPVGSYDTNVTGTLRLLEAARHAGAKRVVFAASSAAYGDSEELPKREDMTPQPVSPYASGKVAGEHLLRVFGKSYGMHTVSLRYFNIYGPRQADDSPYTGVIAIFARALLQGKQAKIYGDGEQSRDFTYVANVVHANLLAMDKEGLEPGLVMNVGAGDRTSLNKLYGAMAELIGMPSEPTYEAPRVGDVRHSEADLSYTKATLGYEPKVQWRDGLARTVDWYRDRMASVGG